MSATIKNLFEVQEPEGDYGQALFLRKKSISKFSTLGPPDLCYLTKTLTKPFGRTKGSTKIGFYHYTYGVDVSSPAAISIYVNSLLKSQETESSWFSAGNWAITNAIYCVYDSFRQIDVRAEFSIPGSMRLYAITRDEQLIAIEGTDWDSVFISAVLRSFNPEKFPFTRFHRELSTKAQLKDFLNAVANFSTKKDLEFENDELLAFRGNRVLHYVNDYLIRKRRLSFAMDFFTELTKSDKRCAAFIADIFSCMSRYPDSVRLIAPILQKNPHISVLIYQEAESLMKAEKYELALKLAKVVIQLCPDSFDAWYLLAEIFFYSKHFNEALIAINTCPFYTKFPHNDGIMKAKSSQITKPKASDLCNSHSHYMFEPSWEVYTPTQFNEEVAKLSSNFLEENDRIIDAMKNLPAFQFNPHEMKIYKLLVKIEREIGWEALLKIRSTLFIMETENYTKPGQRDLDSSKIEDYKISESDDLQEKSEINFIPGLSMNEQSFHAVKQGGENYVANYREDFETLDSVRLEDMPSFLRDGEWTQNAKNILSTGTMASRPIYQRLMGQGLGEASRIEDEENELEAEEESPNEKFKRFLNNKEVQYSTGAKFDPVKIINLQKNNKRLCSRMLERFFIALHQDLNVLYEWQHEENQERSILHGGRENAENDEEDKLKYSVIVWLHRGILAERLCRTSFAEKAYRIVIEKAISLYALARLFKLYLDSESVKAALLCFSEIIEEMEVEGIKTFQFLPNWLEEPLLQLISAIGLPKFKLILKDTKLANEHVINVLIKEAEFWEVGKFKF